jgi:transposase
MSGSAAKVGMTERQQDVLREIAQSRTSPKHLVQRATIVLRAFERIDNADIAREVDMNAGDVGKWRRRWAQRWRSLILIESQESRAEFKRALERVLSDEPRSGNPGKFTPEQITLLLALACESPGTSGRPITHWTTAELIDEAKKRKIVDSISKSQMRRYLDEAELKPHKSRYWLNAKEKEKDPVEFQRKVQEVCDCYLNAQRLHAQENTHTVCIDEMTGIQALERIAPTLPMTPGRTEAREFEYQRHGTLTYIGNFDVVSGRLIAPTIGPTRTEEDFVKHVAQTVATDPTASWVFVVDNLNIHASEGLVKYVAETCEVADDLGKKRQSGSAPIASDAACVSFGSEPPHPLPVPAQAHLMAQPN